MVEIILPLGFAVTLAFWDAARRFSQQACAVTRDEYEALEDQINLLEAGLVTTQEVAQLKTDLALIWARLEKHGQQLTKYGLGTKL